MTADDVLSIRRHLTEVTEFIDEPVTVEIGGIRVVDAFLVLGPSGLVLDSRERPPDPGYSRPRHLPIR